MQIPKHTRDNLRFLIAEVGSQVSSLQSYLESGSVDVAQKVLGRSGYALNLKERIHESCINRLAGSKSGEVDILAFRAVETIATYLERIAEQCRECVSHINSVTHKRLVDPQVYGDLLEQVCVGIELIEAAMLESDTRLALELSAVEKSLDRAYNRLLKGYIADLKKKKHTEDLVSVLFVAHTVERMGDALLAISEAIISANLGQTVSIDRYHSLHDSVSGLEHDKAVNEYQLETVAQTRSGSGISGIADPAQDSAGYVAIYKDGEKRKLKEERQGVESWHEIYPGLAPRILSYRKRGKSAALLVEHLAGLTMEQIVLQEPDELLADALDELGRTLKSVWRQTRKKKPVAAGFMRQTRKRLDQVYTVHPGFRYSDSVICGLDVPSFESLVDRAQVLEEELETPFSVYIHGDFNVDNIIYDPLGKKIRFIDLHRSRYMDYVQDVSVFMVSNYRLRVLDAPARRRMMGLAADFCRFSRAFADKAGDHTFEVRLALGLARSFATSTRFILDKTLARRMFLRARFLLEQVLALSPKQAARYRVPIREIFIG